MYQHEHRPTYLPETATVKDGAVHLSEAVNKLANPLHFQRSHGTLSQPQLWTVVG